MTLDRGGAWLREPHLTPALSAPQGGEGVSPTSSIAIAARQARALAHRTAAAAIPEG